ncbi:MAG TPA: hypothetical protein VLR26_00370 [Frankiaceae bacterium]|nr:hypothetical protein [Frankiaceae bacterium]
MQHETRTSVRLHPYERDRLDSLASYAVLDTPREASFDALTSLAAGPAVPAAAVAGLLRGHRFEHQTSAALMLPSSRRPASSAACS